MALLRLARPLYESGRANVGEAFVYATFASAGKWASSWGSPAVARARRSSQSPLVTVFLSPDLC